MNTEDYLTKEEERLLLRVARDAVVAAVQDKRRLDVASYSLTPTLLEKHGAFVTLRNQGELRGCIGYTASRVSLAEAVRDNAINAATQDFRFSPVTADELDSLSVEVSALTPGDTPGTPFKSVKDVSEIEIGRDGLYIEIPPNRGGLLLPQVPVEHGWDIDTFLAATCRKAGYPEDAWRDPRAQLYRFSAQVFSDEPT